MNDPIAPVIEKIGKCNQVQTAVERKWLKPNFLNTVGEIFENYGYETTRVYLMNKKEQHEMRGQADALLSVLDIIHECAAIRQHRAIGRQIIKTLNAI